MLARSAATAFPPRDLRGRNLRSLCDERMAVPIGFLSTLGTLGTLSSRPSAVKTLSFLIRQDLQDSLEVFCGDHGFKSVKVIQVFVDEGVHIGVVDLPVEVHQPVAELGHLPQLETQFRADDALLLQYPE